MKNLVFSVRSFSGITARITCSSMSARICSLSASSLCWVLITTVSTAVKPASCGSPSRTTVTWALASGRR